MLTESTASENDKLKTTTAEQAEASSSTANTQAATSHGAEENH